MAINWNEMHEIIHMMRAVGPESAFGEYLETEFRVLTMHRKSVRSKPSLPGIAVGGIMKLTYKKDRLENFFA